jgi:plasmid stability protein
MICAAESWISTRMPTELRDELRRLATEHDRSVSAELRTAVRAHLERSTDAGGPLNRQANPDGRRGPAAPPAAPLGEEA